MKIKFTEEQSSLVYARKKEQRIKLPSLEFPLDIYVINKTSGQLPYPGQIGNILDLK